MLGESGKLDEELNQLRILFTTPCPCCSDKKPTAALVYADCLRARNHNDEALEVALGFQQDYGGPDDARPMTSPLDGSNLRETLKRVLLQVSYNFYCQGEAVEKEADALAKSEEANGIVENSTSEADCDTEKGLPSMWKYREALVLFEKAMKAAPNDEATRRAYIKIQAKVSHPGVHVLEEPSTGDIQRIRRSFDHWRRCRLEKDVLAE